MGFNILTVIFPEYWSIPHRTNIPLPPGWGRGLTVLGFEYFDRYFPGIVVHSAWNLHFSPPLARTVVQCTGVDPPESPWSRCMPLISFRLMVYITLVSWTQLGLRIFHDLILLLSLHQVLSFWLSTSWLYPMPPPALGSCSTHPNFHQSPTFVHKALTTFGFPSP